MVRSLLKRGLSVVAVTRNSSALRELQRNVACVEMDIAGPPLKCYERMGSPDVLIHLAWDGLPNYMSLHHFETELIRQYSFLKSMIENGLTSLVVAGTCFEYGMQSGELSESSVTNPTNPYGYAKDALRQQLEYLKMKKTFQLSWARLFYVYGEDQPGRSLYPLLRNAVLQGDETFHMSAGDQIRDYLPVEDVANQLVQLAAMRADTGPINVCSGKPTSVRSLVERWLKQNNWDIELKLGYYPYPDYEPMEFWGNPEQIQFIMKRKGA